MYNVCGQKAGNNLKKKIYANIKLNKKLFILFIALLGVLFFIGCCNVIIHNKSTQVNTGANSNSTIIIDPGHGGIDGGAIGVGNINEKDINLKISLKLRDMLTSFGFRVIMTREEDKSIHDDNANTIRMQKKTDMHNRLALMEKFENPIFISIHQNTSPYKNATGSVVYYSANCPESQNLASIMQNNFTTLLQPDNKREIVQAKSNLFLLYKAKCPAVLTECGFISNGKECAMLQDDDYQNKICFLILKSLLEYFEQR